MRDLEQELRERDQRIDDLLETARQLLRFFCHLELSASQADLLLNYLAKLWKTDFDALVEMMAWATVVYMDETGWKVSAKRCYAWVFTSLLHPQVEATNNISERIFRNSAQARNTGRTSKTPAGCQQIPARFRIPGTGSRVALRLPHQKCDRPTRPPRSTCATTFVQWGITSIWGKVVWYENIGTRRKPILTAAQPIRVQWPGKPPKPAWNWWSPRDNHLVTQWRTTPVVVDFDRDGLNDLVMLDHEGYLALFKRRRTGKKLVLLPGQRLFVDENDRPLKLSAGRAGKSGRRKIHVVDWDGDGRLDLLVNSRSADLLRQIAVRNGKYVFRNTGPLTRHKLSGHTTSPATINFKRDGKRDLLIGAEDGHLYLLRRPRTR